jgi:hypothetical protein
VAITSCRWISSGQRRQYINAAVSCAWEIGKRPAQPIEVAVPTEVGQHLPDAEAGATHLGSPAARLVGEVDGPDTGASGDLGLRLAMERQAPLIYFHGIVPGLYEPAWPVFIVEDDPAALTFIVAIEDEVATSTAWQFSDPGAQPRLTLGAMAGDPFPHRGLTQAHGGRDGGGAFAPQDAAHDLCSTARRAPCILVNVHPGLLHCGDGRLATTSFAAAARMGLNNLLTVHS